jgi:serine acetyltransferase
MIFDPSKLDRLRADVERRARRRGLRGSAAWRLFWADPQNRTLAWHRWSEAARSSLLRFLCLRLYLRSSRRSGLEILTPDLGGGVILPHWGRIILNATAIGQNLCVFHGVTVGNDFVSGRPRLGSDVFLGAGSIVMGNISVGDNVIVAAGSVVVGDVPSCSLVAGNPARVVRGIEPGEVRRMIGY